MIYEVACISLTIFRFSDSFSSINVVYSVIWLGPMVGYLANIISKKYYLNAL